ncbi:MAG TPA: tRNA uridine-5-carboxymethylaminomethyl(34) synthesis GTPase MnmE [Rhodopseudomonas sp.]|uniref:tRNA uridine-5-carboxymethylaminomethyl(34) synthesis GTPase MnmE n=1 Tax=Rhodopseudomonas sp. TaxID=1078 RepID=UPI002EDB862F
MHPRQQTIFALSSGRPPSAIAIIRVSGPEAATVLERIAGRLPPPRQATRAVLKDARGQPIDDAVVLWFPGPASATGEDVAEFHIHGGRAVLQALVAAIATIDNLRAAEPGEFTRRAFENGKLDLTEAEGLDDLIHADTERQRRLALRQLKGLLGDRARDWRGEIIAASALVEAAIDFADEGDVPDELIAPAKAKIEILLDEIEEVLAQEGRSEKLRDGLVVAITGPPNVGKSTLMNQLARREVAIVSPHAGTTRDIIEVHLDLDGYPVTVIDTAGIREASDPVEQEGVRRARSRAAEADLRLWLVDTQAAGDGEEPLRQWMAAGQHGFWVVRNKVDEAEAAPPNLSATGWPCHSISAASGRGVAELIAALARFAAAHFDEGSALISRARHRQLLRQTADALGRAVDLPEAAELIAEELRIAAHRLGQLLGWVDVEDILDVIFREFCVGK